MARKRFKSKIDRWLLILLVAIMIFEIFVMSIAAMQSGDPRTAVGLVAAALLIVALIGSLLIGTHYTVDGNTLRIVSGPFRWKVPIDKIQSVQATRSPFSSPALSLDRLRIDYGGRRRIMVSPADKAGFLRAINQDIDRGADNGE
jgi:uncharacterized membrane protein YdbT with pleckstrin-like domain